jgi:hypothetical protein
MADIQLDSITNDADTGVFDKLMAAVNAQIESQYLNNRITGSDYANVYLGGMQAVLQQSMQFALQEQLTEAQIEDVVAGTALKTKQLEIAGQELAAKTYEVETLLPDQHNTNVAQQTILATQEEAEQYKVDSLMPAELAQIQKQTDVAERTITEQELTGAKQRTILDTEEQAKQYEVDNILPANLAQVQKQTDVAERGMVEQESTGSKQRLVLDKDIALKTYENTVLQSDQHNTNIAQQTLLATEEQAKQYEVDNILPANLAQIQKQTDVAERDMAEQEATGSKQRLVLDQDIAIKEYENTTLQVDQHNKLVKDVDVAERGMVEQELTGIKQRIILDTEEEAKQYEVDHLLPEQLTKLQEEIDLLQSQDQAVYTDRVLKDKQAAKLGLDNVMKQAEAARQSDPSFVYTPNYEETL